MNDEQHRAPFIVHCSSFIVHRSDMFEPNTYQYFEDVNWGLLRLWGDRSGRDVLDVGCGFATTSQSIQRGANRVVGIESNGDAVVVARRRIQQVINADLTNVDEVRGAVGGRRF